MARTSCEWSRRPDEGIQRDADDLPLDADEVETATRRNSAVFWSTPEVNIEVPSCVDR